MPIIPPLFQKVVSAMRSQAGHTDASDRFAASLLARVDAAFGPVSPAMAIERIACDMNDSIGRWCVAVSL